MFGVVMFYCRCMLLLAGVLFGCCDLLFSVGCWALRCVSLVLVYLWCLLVGLCWFGGCLFAVWCFICYLCTCYWVCLLIGLLIVFGCDCWLFGFGWCCARLRVCV